MTEIIEILFYPVMIVIIMVALYMFFRRPEMVNAMKDADYQRAHPYGPCCNNDQLRTTLEKYVSETEFVRRQEEIHDNCEGHAICDLISTIEYDYIHLPPKDGQ